MGNLGARPQRLSEKILRKEQGMKFYYKGKLIRTSKTHHYTHAIIYNREDGTFACHGCSATEQGAEKLYRALPNVHNYGIWLSVQNGTYKKKDKWSNSIEKMRENAVKYYGSVDEAVEAHRKVVARYEIVEIEER